jgi:hypothetical protein
MLLSRTRMATVPATPATGAPRATSPKPRATRAPACSLLAPCASARSNRVHIPGTSTGRSAPGEAVHSLPTHTCNTCIPCRQDRTWKGDGQTGRGGGGQKVAMQEVEGGCGGHTHSSLRYCRASNTAASARPMALHMALLAGLAAPLCQQPASSQVRTTSVAPDRDSTSDTNTLVSAAGRLGPTRGARMPHAFA